MDGIFAFSTVISPSGSTNSLYIDVDYNKMMFRDDIDPYSSIPLVYSTDKNILIDSLFEFKKQLNEIDINYKPTYRFSKKDNRLMVRLIAYYDGKYYKCRNEIDRVGITDIKPPKKGYVYYEKSLAWPYHSDTFTEYGSKIIDVITKFMNSNDSYVDLESEIPSFPEVTLYKYKEYIKELGINDIYNSPNYVVLLNKYQDEYIIDIWDLIEFLKTIK